MAHNYVETADFDRERTRIALLIIKQGGKVSSLLAIGSLMRKGYTAEQIVRGYTVAAVA